MGSYLPGGAVVLSVFLVILSALGIICGILFFSQPIPPDVSINLERSWLYAWVYSYHSQTGYFPLDVFSLAGMEISYTERLSYALLQRILAWSGLLLGTLGVLSGAGLLTAKKWGRYLTLMLGTIIIVLGLAIVSMFIFGIGKMHQLTIMFAIMLGLTFSVIGVLLVAYMMGEVKYYFD